MKTRQLFLTATLLPVLALVFAGVGQAQTKLPWERNTQAPKDSTSRDGRAYNEPGEAYDPAQHGGTDAPQENYRRQGNYGRSGSAGAQGSTSQYNRGGYDQSYDALRNDNRRPPQSDQYRRRDDRQAERPYGDKRKYQAPRQYDKQPDNRYRRAPQQGYQQEYRRPAYPRQDYPRQGYRPPASHGPGQAYAPPPGSAGGYAPYNQRPAISPEESDTFSDDEILNAGHKFFGQISKGLAKVIAHVFKKSGRPNAYILGEEGGGALIAGLRYGEGRLYTKAGERRRIYWQGPSIGYDFGAEGAKTMILVYNLRDIEKMYGRFAGVDGSAYFIGGIGVTFQKRGRVVLAPIRSGLGLRLGANVGYLKYTRRPTWNPF